MPLPAVLRTGLTAATWATSRYPSRSAAMRAPTAEPSHSPTRRSGPPSRAASLSVTTPSRPARPSMACARPRPTSRRDDLVNRDLWLWRLLLRRKRSQVRQGTPRFSNPALVTANMPEPDTDDRPAIDLPASPGGLTFHEPHPGPGKHRQRRAVQILGGDYQPGRLPRSASVSVKRANQLRNHSPGHLAKVPPC